ncbi:MAG: hypothetical protein KDD94_08135 [Calditrichaeota bacterium]|nr:hypothetical protein [Calditrichota bacterium]
MKHLIIYLLLLINLSVAQNPYFINDERLYQFFEYMETTGKLSYLNRVRPYSAGTVKELLNKISSADLSDYERNWFQSFPSIYLSDHRENIDLMSNLSSEPLNNIIGSSYADSISHFVYWAADKSHLIGQITIENEFMSQNKSADIASFYYSLYGTINNLIFFNVDNRESSIFGNSQLALTESKSIYGNYFNQYFKEGNLSTDATSGYLVFDFDKANLWLGKLPFLIGDGESGKFVLNGFQTTPFSSFGFSFNLWKIRYHMLHGSLLASELKTGIVDSTSLQNSYLQVPDKYLVSHRFEVELTDQLMLHYNELLIYGNRSIDLNYLNPFSFLRSLEHELQDRDNVLISLGFNLGIPDYHIRLYTDILLDEWKLSKIGTNWFGNKHGIMNGISWANYGLQLWFEHVAIRPFTYTHKFPVNRYTHDGDPLGYAAGPNSQTFFFKAAYQLNPDWRFELDHRFQRKGNNFDQSDSLTWNIGGDVFKGHVNENKGSIESITENVEFLSGNIINTNETTVRIEFQPNYYLKTRFEYSISDKKSNLLRFLFSISY